MPNFLRYGELIIELTDAPLVVGRSSACDIVIDDELASREHCRITVDAGRVTITDLDSKNGVFVNGELVDRSAELHHGDAVTIGAQQLVLQRQARSPRVTPAIGHVRPPPNWEDSGAFTMNPTKPGNFFTLIQGAAMMSLEGRDITSAESGARNFFASARASLARSRALPPGVLDQAATLGLAMCEHTQDARWLEQLLELHTSARIAISDAYLERLVTMVRAYGRPAKAMDDYLWMAHEAGATSSIRALSRL